MHRFALLIERRARHVQFSRAIDRSYFGVEKRLICRELLAIFDASVKMKMTRAVTLYLLFVTKLLLLNIFAAFSLFSLSLFFFYIHALFTHTSQKHTTMRPSRARQRE